VRRRSVECVPQLTLFNRSSVKPTKHSSFQLVVLWIRAPWMRHRLRKLKEFAGRETYTAQLKRVREIEVLEACLLHS
jgi:hypothetical protein